MAVTKNTHFQTPIESVTSEDIAGFDGEHAIVFNKTTGEYVGWNEDANTWGSMEGAGTSKSGWQDFADNGTSEASPLQQTNVLGGSVQIINNNQGVLTDGTTSLNSVTTLVDNNTGGPVLDLWKTSSNTLEFKDKGLKENDTFDMRIDLTPSSNTVPSDLFILLEFYDDIDAGGSFIFSQTAQFLSITSNAGVFKNNSIVMDFFLGSSIVNGSCKISLVGSTAFEVNVIGFNIDITRK